MYTINKTQMKIKSFTFSPFQENTYVLYDETLECVIIDPGCYDHTEEFKLSQFITENKLKPVFLLNTHAHIDHIFGNAFVSRKFDIKPRLHELDMPTFNLAELSAKMYGVNYNSSPEPNLDLKEGDQIKFGNQLLDIIFIPGHAPGHVVFYNRVTKQIIGGDVLFENSIGRTDLPGGNHQQLLDGIKAKLFILDEDIRVYPGHGDSTTIGQEKKTNPFF